MQTGAGIVSSHEATPSSAGGAATGPTSGQQAWETTKNVASATYSKVLLRTALSECTFSHAAFDAVCVLYTGSSVSFPYVTCGCAQTAETAQAAKDSEAYKVWPWVLAAVSRPECDCSRCL